MFREVWTEEDKVEAEEKIEQAVSYFENTPKGRSSLYKRNLNRNIFKREMAFLNDNFPSSVMCSRDYSDVPLLDGE